MEFEKVEDVVARLFVMQREIKLFQHFLQYFENFVRGVGLGLRGGEWGGLDIGLAISRMWV